MRIFLLILISFAIVPAGISQGSPSARIPGNKEKLASMDSLLRQMQQKKNKLAVLFEDFLRQSAKFKNQDSVITGKTIQQRITAIETNAKKRVAAGKTNPVNSSLTAVEQTVGKISKILDEISAVKNKLKDKRDSISEMGEMDMLMLQQMMDKKNQLEVMISNVMKAAYEGGQAAISALKAS